jgi:hypothetical protein
MLIRIIDKTGDKSVADLTNDRIKESVAKKRVLSEKISAIASRKKFAMV